MAIGPKIILTSEPVTQHLMWLTDNVQQGDGGVSNGVLREDYIGLSISKFRFRETAGGPWTEAEKVEIRKSGGSRLELIRTSLDTLHWRFVRSDGAVISFFATDRWTPNSVPSELLGPFDSIRETVHDKVCHEVEVVVNLP